MIFDSDILIWAFRRDAAAGEFLTAEPDRAASIITLMEIFVGARSKAELMPARSFFVEFDIRLIPVTDAISFKAANLIEDHCLSGGLDISDALIAATAHETGETLGTANSRHFRRIPNLAIKAFRPRR